MYSIVHEEKYRWMLVSHSGIRDLRLNMMLLMIVVDMYSQDFILNIAYVPVWSSSGISFMNLRFVLRRYGQTVEVNSVPDSQISLKDSG
jgi:hypothetical protein